MVVPGSLPPSQRPARDGVDRSTFVIRVIEGADAGASTRIDAATPRVLVGHSPACSLRLRDEGVASRHASIVLDGDRLKLVDLGSTNGTTINGVTIETAFLLSLIHI